MEHIQAIQEVVDTHKDEMPVYVVVRVMEECQKLYASLRDQNSGEGDVDEYPEVTRIDPPAGIMCHDINNEVVNVGDIVRVGPNRRVNRYMKVESIVYLGFEDRQAATRFSEPGFMLSPNESDMDLVNAGDCEKIDMQTGVWLEHETPEYGWFLIEVPEGIEKGRFYFANNVETYTTYYETFKLTLWNEGVIDRSTEK